MHITPCLASVHPDNSYAKQAEAAVQAAASGSEQQRQQLSRKMTSSVNSCLKSLAASAVLQAERQRHQQGSKQTQGVQRSATLTTEQCVAGLTQPLEPAEGSYWPEIDTVAVAASMCCSLGKLLSEQTPAQVAESSSSNGSTSGGSSAARPGSDWMVLAAKCMLHVTTWLQQQPSTAITAAAVSTYRNTGEVKQKAGPAAAFCHMAMLLEQCQDAEQGSCQLVGRAHTSSLVLVLHTAMRTVRWLSRQLLASSISVGSSTVIEAAAAAVLRFLADKADATAGTLEVTVEKLHLFVHKHASSSAADSSALVTMHQQLQDCWQQLQSLATSVLAELPVSSCCGNPSCFNMAKLSEWQVVGGKGCLCDGCGVARYCSRACQVKMWHKLHRVACMRLRQVSQFYLQQLDDAVDRWLFESGGHM
jgi:hypothetical protein